MVKIIEKFAYKDTKPRPGLALKPKYITIHNTANTKKGANAAAHANLLRNGGKNKSVSYHYCVDDKEIYYIIPENEVAWHAGDGRNGKGNRQSLAIEICENKDGNLLKATDNAVELAARLAVKHNIPLENIVQHNHWSGKNCPRQIRKGNPYSWSTFKSKVAKEIKELKAPKEDKKPAPKPETSDKKEPAKKTFGKDGQAVKISQTYVYVSATSAKPSSVKSGVFYIWDNEVVNDRIRITNSKEKVGQKGQVTGWISINKIQEDKPKTSTPAKKTYEKGDKIVVSKKPLYVSSTAKTSTSKKTGTYYIYDGQKVNGRYRVTKKEKNCGKKPVALYVSGWMAL